MSYVDKQIAAARKTLGDAVAGRGLQNAIRALQEKSRITDSLKTLPARGAITAKRKNAKRTGGAEGDFTELSRSYHATTRSLTSTDGLFVIRWNNISVLVTDRARFNFLDYAP